MQKRPMLLLAGFAMASAAAPAFAGTLLSPWDARKVALTGEAYACPATPTMPKDVAASDYYSDAKHSIADPARKAAYEEAAAPFTEVSREVEKAADTFQKTGSRAAANCVVEILTRAVVAESMTGEMSSNQAEYVRNWTLGALAVSWLKVREAGPGRPEQAAAIAAWMKKVAEGVEGYFEPRRVAGKNDGQNNHLYWAGFSVMAAGVAADDRKLYDWGVGTYKDGVSRIQEDGTLPLEMARGRRALHYHLFALGPLVMMAELGEANGDDLYAFDHEKLHLLAVRSLSGVVKNDYFAAKTGVAQDTPEPNGKIKSDDVVWAVPFERRFPDPAVAQLLQRTGLAPYRYLGGLPPQ